MSSIYPQAIDGFSQLPLVIDTVTEIKGDTVNRLRSAIINIEKELGIIPSSNFSTLSERLQNIDSQISTLLNSLENTESSISSIQEDLAILKNEYFAEFNLIDLNITPVNLNNIYQVVGTADGLSNKFINGIDWEVVLNSFSVTPISIFLKVEGSHDSLSWFPIQYEFFDSVNEYYTIDDYELKLEDISSEGSYNIRIPLNFFNYRLSIKTESGTAIASTVRFKRF